MNNLEYKAAYTPTQLATENRKLNIPIYQRLFVWEEEQINLLLQDLENSFNNFPDTPYYIGIITVVEKNGKWDIVDGQQRLTFLSLFGAYCCSQNPHSIWHRFLYTANDLRINYMGRSEDKEVLKKIAKGDTDIANRNFRIFSECMKKKFPNSIPEDFTGYVYNHASFLITELPANYAPQDLNLFFEKMNATGKQLTAVEQIKGKYFPAHAAEFDACLNFEKTWKDSTSSAGAQAVSLGTILTDTRDVESEGKNFSHDITSSSILTPEIFLLHCLEICYEGVSKDVSKDERKILETFKNIVEPANNMVSDDDLLKTMKDYRQWLDNNIIYLKATSDGSWEYAFRREEKESREYEDNAEKESDGEVNLRLKMKQFQAMLYVSSSNYQEWVLQAYRSKEPFSLDWLKKQDKNRHPYNENSMTYHSIDRYWFWKLDYLLWEQFIDSNNQFKYLPSNELTSNEEDAVRNFKFRRNRSIEHLHPQTDGEIEEWKTAKHQFGNLAMISSSFNSLQQNDSIGVKFARLRDTQIPQKNLESIKMLLMFKIAEGKEEGWTVENMNKHEEAMLTLLQENQK